MNRAGQDFPYCAGHPVGFSGGRWLLLMLSVLAGFLVLEFLPATSPQAQLIGRLLFVAIPLCTLTWLAGRHASALFGRLTARDVLVAVLAAVVAIVASVLAALAVRQFASVAPNALAVRVTEMSGSDFILNLLSAAPQLLGEEMLTILPLLAVLWLATARLGLSRRWGIAVALFVSTLIFCAAHLPTYHWNWAQCFGVIAAPRLVLSLAYLLTRKLWVSTAAHVLTDWTELTLAFVASAHG